MRKIAALLCAVLMIYVFGGLLDNVAFAEEPSDTSEDETTTTTTTEESTEESTEEPTEEPTEESTTTTTEESNDEEPTTEETTTTKKTKKKTKKKTNKVTTTTTTVETTTTTTTAETEQTTEVEEDKSVIITKDALIAAAESGDDVKVSGFTEDGFEYQWLIKGTDIVGEVTDIDVTVYNTSDYKDRMRAFVPRHIGLAAISFAENGELPAKAQLTIDTGGVLATGNAYLYTYNRATGRAELVEEVKFADDRVEIILQERMDYFLTDQLLDEGSKEMSGAVKLTVMTVIGLLVAGIFGLVVSKVRDIQVYRRELIGDTGADGAYTVDDDVDADLENDDHHDADQ